MGAVSVDQQKACSAGVQATAAYVGLLRSARSQDKVAVGEWTVGDTATHTAHVFETYAQVVKGLGGFPDATTTTMNDHWARRLGEDSARAPADAADRIEAAAADVWAGYAAMPAGETVEWYGGLEVPAFTPPCIIITEALVHGFDIARAEGLPWDIDTGVARLSIRGLFPLLPRYVDAEAARDVRACYELRLRGDPPVFLTFENGALSIDDAPARPVDCKLSVDPTAYLLVGYGRIGQWGPVAKGKVLTWGRKPWLGLKLGKMIASP